MDYFKVAPANEGQRFVRRDAWAQSKRSVVVRNITLRTLIRSTLRVVTPDRATAARLLNTAERGVAG